MKSPAMRDEFIDFLRFVGLALIVFAHVAPPPALFQLRNFDVSLMVLVAALSFSLSYRPGTSFRQYVAARVLRLLVPVWIFLTLYFGALWIVDPASADLHPRTILGSYALLGGIGYVWIVRVFLLLALVAPLAFRLHRSLPDNGRYLAALVALYVLYVLCFHATAYINIAGVSRYFSAVVCYAVPYGLVFAYGLRLPAIGQRGHALILAAACGVFFALGAWLYERSGHIVPTQDFKYPPRLYYLSYALIGAEVLWLAGPRIWAVLRSVPFIRALVLFVARNSLWIYLWHIPFARHLEAGFLPKYILVFTAAALIAAAQSAVVHRTLLPRIASDMCRKKIRAVLTG